MGGLTGLILAASQPQRLRRLMIVDALPFFSVLIDPNATAETIKPMAEATAAFMIAQPEAAFRAGQERTMRTLVKNPAWQGPALEASLASDRGLVAAVTAEVMQTDMRPQLPAVTVPTTVLYAYDAAMPAPPAVVERLYQSNYAGLPGVRLERVDNALHFIMVDQPEAFAAAVDRFLAAP
jgi:pimeloyl-ACP methyl ester carboxylesterase